MFGFFKREGGDKNGSTEGNSRIEVLKKRIAQYEAKIAEKDGPNPPAKEVLKSYRKQVSRDRADLRRALENNPQ